MVRISIWPFPILVLILVLSPLLSTFPVHSPIKLLGFYVLCSLGTIRVFLRPKTYSLSFASSFKYIHFLSSHFLFQFIRDYWRSLFHLFAFNLTYPRCAGFLLTNPTLCPRFLSRDTLIRWLHSTPAQKYRHATVACSWFTLYWSFFCSCNLRD